MNPKANIIFLYLRLLLVVPKLSYQKMSYFLYFCMLYSSPLLYLKDVIYANASIIYHKSNVEEMLGSFQSLFLVWCVKSVYHTLQHALKNIRLPVSS